MDAIHASGGRALTRAKATSVIVKGGRAAGVTVAREVPGSQSPAAAAGVKVMVTVDGSGSVISSVGVIDSFRGLVPHSPTAAAETVAGAGVVVRSEAAAAGETAKALGEKEGDGLDPTGFRILRAARPRVHLCVGLQGNWLEDLDGTSSYVHHVSFWLGGVLFCYLAKRF